MTAHLSIETQAAAGLKRRRQRLLDAVRENRGLDFLQRQARLLDDYFREVAATTPAGAVPPFALIAVGGYGRREQCVHSDVDLLFLFEDHINPQAADMVGRMVTPLWDIGLVVGHATRSVADCLALAEQDLAVLTSLLDARPIAGLPDLQRRLHTRLRRELIGRNREAIVGALIDRHRQRHRQFGDATYLLEPNLKEGQGGLRDYHAMLWMARIRYDLTQSRDLEYQGHLSHMEFQGLTHALKQIWQVRNRLHLMAGRKCDQLHFEYQESLARTLGFGGRHRRHPVEGLLEHIHGQLELIKQCFLMFVLDLENPPDDAQPHHDRQRTICQGLEVKRGRLHFAASEKLMATPTLLMAIFETSAHLGIPLSSESKRVVREFRFLVDADFRNRAHNLETFERILVTPAPVFNVLHEMLATGFLAAYLPEFRGIINRIQYDAVHLYPVDKHALRTVQVLKQLAQDPDRGADSPYAKIYDRLPVRKLLLWAALLHDIGKTGSGEGHARRGARMAEGLLTRSGLSDQAVKTVTFLIAEHLFLVHTATRRDIKDEETAIFCARRLGDVDRLQMLYLLSVADAMATGPKAWNSWIEALLRDLYLKILNILEGGELASRQAIETIDGKRSRVLKAPGLPIEHERLEDLVTAMSPRYLLNVPAEDICRHVALFERFDGINFVWQIDRPPDPGLRKITVCAPNRPGLFSKIAGSFTLNRVEILDAQIFTWRNNVAVDIFWVKAPPDTSRETRKWNRTQVTLGAVLAGELDPGAELSTLAPGWPAAKPVGLPKEHRVVVDNSSSSFFTIIEVFSQDFPGILFRITDALFQCRLDVWIAKIATRGDRVVDVFYVRGLAGQKISAPEQVQAIRRAVTAVLPQSAPK